MKLSPRVALSACVLAAALPARSHAQVPSQAPSPVPGLSAGMTPDQLVQLLAQNPQLAAQLRQRLQQSGLTPDQIRAQLATNGYPSNLLDAYLSAAPAGQPVPLPSTQMLAAIQALGLGPFGATEGLPVDTGFIGVRADSVRAESLATGNYVFGVDVFRRTTTQFLPQLTGPVDPQYRLGPGDVLVVVLTGGVEQSYQLEVSREGFIVIPQVGQLFVNNLTLGSARSVLYDRLGRVYSKLRGAEASIKFDVTVSRVRINHVYVIGEVKQPGAYQISGLGSALTALYAAGGVTGRADMRQIEVRRLDKVAATLDLYDYLLRGDKHDDIRLETGDVVYVPLHGRPVQVTGAVLRPAVYELKEGETLPDVLRAAGGFRANAAVDRLTIHRILPAAQRKPGPVPRAALDVALAVAAPDEPRTSARAGDADPLGGVVIPSLPLDNGDSVVVDSVASLDSSLYVAINGMVNKPGRYPWQEGMTLRELLRLARGPRIGASLKDAEIARLPGERSQGQLADTRRAPLDSTYLFERDRSGRYVGAAGQAFQAGGVTRQAYPNGIRFFRREADAGRVGVDLPMVLRDPRYKDNLVLADGDSIYIPAYVPTVRVEGAVNAPTSVTYVAGRGLDYYLNAAGGVSFKGDKGRVFVQ